MKRAFAFAGFSSAITLLILNSFSLSLAYIITVTAVVLFTASLLIKKLRQGRVVPIVFGTALFSCLVFMLVMTSSVIPELKLAENKESIKVSFHITDTPIETNSGYSYKIKTDYIDGNGVPQNIKLTLYTKHSLDAEPYDIITAKLIFSKISDNPFNSYGSYGEGEYVYANLFGNYSVRENEHKPLDYSVIKLRELIKSNLFSSLDDESAGLSLAVLTGNKAYLSDEIINDFIVCGASHIMAVSGLHISILCFGFFTLFSKLGFNKKVLSLITIILALLYIAVSGYSRSVIRAGIMLFVMLISKLFNKKADSLNSLGLATFILCLNPFAVTDSGAVLTVLSVLGIVEIKPVFDKYTLKFIKNKIGKKSVKYIKPFVSSVNSTISVLISTFPAVCLFFGKISLASIVVNVVIFAFIEVVVILSALSAIFGGVHFLSIIPAFLTELFDRFLLETVSFFAQKLSILYVDISGVYYVTAAALVILFVALSLLIFKKIKPFEVLAFLMIAFMLAASMSVYDYKNTAFLYVSDSDCLIVGHTSTVIAVDIDNKSDYYIAKRNIDFSKSEKIIFINSDYNNEKLSSLTDGESVFIDDEKISIDLSEVLSVKCNGSAVLADVYDRRISIDDNEIMIDNIKVIRNKDKRFQDYKPYIFYVRENRQLLMERE